MKSKENTYKVPIIFTFVVLTFLCIGCLEPIPLPDVSRGYLVVEARFTNDPEINQVILSFAGMVNEGSIPVTGASVYVSDNLGNLGWFDESDEGLYLPRTNGYVGTTGRKYILHIELRDGREYNSDSCLFQDVPPIEDFFWDLKQTPSRDYTRWLQGVEFKIDTYDPNNLPRNFMWTYDEIWETKIAYPIQDIYLGNGQFQTVINPSRCFVHSASSEIMLRSTADQSETILKGYPIAFISNESTRLWLKYRIQVYQYNLSDEAYFYIKQLLEITSQTGSIFDKQPSTLIGNIRSTENPFETVMGYFIVSGVSTRSITINTTGDLPSEYRGPNSEFEKCVRSLHSETLRSRDIDQVLLQAGKSGFNLVARDWFFPETGEPILIGLLVAPWECTVCLGTTEIPENWD